MSEIPLSTCACRKPQGCYGRGTHHYFVPTFEQLMDRAIRNLIRENPEAAYVFREDARLPWNCGEEGDKIRQAADRFRESVTRPCKAAAGKPWAYERCEEDRNRSIRQIERRKASARQGDDFRRME